MSSTSVPRPLTRRLLMTGVAGAALAVPLAACGKDDPGSPAATPSGSGSADADTFPVTIEHRFGTTTVPQLPKRVVALGGGDMEAAIALGAPLVAGADWFGFEELRPWVRDALDGAPEPEIIVANTINFEQVAGLQPDLILYVNTVNDEADYTTLAKIAPTVAAPSDVTNVYGVPWQDQLEIVGRATGLSTAVPTVRQETEDVIAAAREAHPEFDGKTITAGVFSPEQLSAWVPSDPRMRLLTELGFVTNPKVAELDDGDFYVVIAPERLDLIDADAVFLAALDADGKVSPELLSQPLYDSIPAVEDGRVAYFPGPATILSATPDGNFSSAFSIGGPLGIAACMDRLTDLLAGAVAGDR